jgi:SAM-dependent methyltransferase
MSDAVKNLYEAHPDPSPASVPIGSDQLQRIDDNLHYGWSWHRHRFCFRRGEGIRILDAGCGTGLSTLGLARLNPGASVIGVDLSPRSLELARERAAAAGAEGVEFHEHDLDQPLPGSWGPFDFIVCRRVLGQAGDPVRILKNLAKALDPRGLLLITLPTRVGRQPARLFRQAVEALAAPGMTLEEKAGIARQLFQALRPDHPLRQYEATLNGAGFPDNERLIAGYLGAEEREYDLPEAQRLLEDAGLQFLMAPPRWPWRPERVFVAPAVSGELKARVEGVSGPRLATLIAAIDPALHLDEFRIYACLADFEPRLPTWPDDRAADPSVMDRLIPHRTTLVQPEGPAPTLPVGRVRYKTVTGAAGELDARSHLLLQAVDGRTPCGEINGRVSSQAGVLEEPERTQERWIELSNAGFVLLESPDPRQHVDCRHQGPILDRLDCACPRRWVRACDRHGYCTITAVEPGSESFPALQGALARLNAERVVACATCPDYDPEA